MAGPSGPLFCRFLDDSGRLGGGACGVHALRRCRDGRPYVGVRPRALQERAPPGPVAVPRQGRDRPRPGRPADRIPRRGPLDPRDLRGRARQARGQEASWCPRPTGTAITSGTTATIRIGSWPLARCWRGKGGRFRIAPIPSGTGEDPSTGGSEMTSSPAAALGRPGTRISKCRGFCHVRD